MILLLGGCSGPSTSASAPAPAPAGPASLNREAPADPASTVSNVSVALTPGWNPVGLKCQRITAIGASSSIAGVATYANGAYGTRPLDTTLNGRQGLMVFATGATNLTYSGTDDGQGNFVDLQSGWNLVSFCTDQDLPGSRLAPLPAAVLPTFYLATATQNVAVDMPAGTLKAGGAYWVFANASARLTIAPPPTSPVTSVTLSPPGPVTVSISSTATFTLTATFADGTRRDVTADATWTSAAPSTAALLSPGVFKALNPFATTIQGSYGGVAAEAGLQVVINNVPGPLPSPSPVRGFVFPLIARSTTGFLRRFDVAGAALAPDPFSAAAMSGDVGIPAVDKSGNIFFPSNAGQGILKTDGVTGAVTTFATGFASTILEGLAFDSSGNLYVSQISPAGIFRVPPAGTPITPVVSAGLATPAGLAFDVADNFYVADASNNRVYSYTSAGTLRTSWGTGGSVPAGNTPIALAFDSSGQLYVSENGSARVERISADGLTVTPFVTGIPSPSGLAIDDSGNLYVQVSGGTVRKYNSAGTLVNGTFITGLTAGIRGIALTPK